MLLLIERIYNHDQIAFEALYLQFHNYVHGIAWRLLHSDCETEEVVQDVFMALWRHPPRLRYGIRSLLAWFTGTTRNQCWMRMRRFQS